MIITSKPTSYEFDSLSQDSKDYVDRYIRTTTLTREDALKLQVIRDVVDEYETAKTRYQPKAIQSYEEPYEEEDRSF